MPRPPKRFSSAPPAVAPYTRKRKNVPDVVEAQPPRLRRRIDDAERPAINPPSTGRPLNSIAETSVAPGHPGHSEAVQPPASVSQWVPARPSTPESTLPPRLRRSASRAAASAQPKSPRPMVRLRVRTHAQTASSAPRAASLPQAAAPPPSAASEQKIRSPDVASVSEPKKSKVNLRVVTNPEAAGSGVKRTTRRTSRFNPIGNVAAARTRATRYDPVRDGVEGTRGRSASPSVPATASPAPASPLAPAPGSPPPPAPGSPPPPTVPRPSPPTVPSPRRTPTLPPVPLPPVRSPTLTGPLFLSPVALVPSLGLSLITTGLSPPPVQLPELFEATVKEETLATPPLSPLHSLQGDLEQGNYVFTNEEEEQERSPSPPPGYDPQNEEQMPPPEGDAYGKASYMGDWPSDRGL